MAQSTQISSERLRQIEISSDISSKIFILQYINCIIKYSETPEMRSYWSIIYKWVDKELSK